MRAVRLNAPAIVVTNAAGAAAADRSAIDAGVPSRALMQRAGVAAAAEIARRFTAELPDGVIVVTGPGNNGGDGWVIARALHAVGISVRVVEAMQSRTPDAQAERTAAIEEGIPFDDDIATLFDGGERIVVDALLGTGLTSDEPLRGRIAEAVATLIATSRGGRIVVAIDLPTGLDASDGSHVGAAPCALTLTFGTLKRGHLVGRDLCGDIVLLDIGLGTHAAFAGEHTLATASWFHASLPRISADAHKGTRGKVAIIGGAEGMAGATMLAARGALRSGAGMVKCVVERASRLAIQEGEPAALCSVWYESDADFTEQVGGWADALLIGPGLGIGRARELTERALRLFDGPVVLDADALNAFAGEPDALASLLAGRAALLTPHPAEFARLAGMDVGEVLETRFDAAPAFAARVKATVLLKGVPTIVSAPDGTTRIVAEGTPVLATGGAGDLLGGIAVALLAQSADAGLAGALAAFAHGRAAASVSARQVRGFTLDDVVAALPAVWSLVPPPARPPVLVSIPAAGEDR